MTHNMETVFRIKHLIDFDYHTMDFELSVPLAAVLTLSVLWFHIGEI